jgi:hypothetical protein
LSGKNLIIPLIVAVLLTLSSQPALAIFPVFQRGDYVLAEFNDSQGNLYRYRTFAP